MVVVAQLVRALDCGSRGRGFEPRHPPFFFFLPGILTSLLLLLFLTSVLQHGQAHSLTFRITIDINK